MIRGFGAILQLTFGPLDLPLPHFHSPFVDAVQILRKAYLLVHALGSLLVPLKNDLNLLV